MAKTTTATSMTSGSGILTEEQILAQMQKNSAAWHSADAATKKQLEAENQKLGAMVGGSYDSASGTWSNKSGSSLYTTPSPAVTNKPTTTYSPTTTVTPAPAVTPTPSTSKAYSPYTNWGSTYDANVDYQAIINEAVANGDYATAAKAEQYRNMKIQGTGSNYAQTNNYSQYLDNGGKTTATQPSTTPSYTPLGTYNDAGLSADAQAKIEIYKNIYNEAVASGDMARANAAHDAAEALRSQYGYSGGVDGSDYIGLDKPQIPTQPTTTTTSAAEIAGWNDNYNANNAQPTYESKYDPQIEAMLNEILSRGDFSYDAANDPLYQQYANMYRREGDRAMKETLAEAAASAGGMNTYAITAAQQANSYYNSQLNDRIPELYQLAYEMYLADKESKVQDLGLLQQLDESQYSRYRDTMSDWRNDKNFAYGAFQDAVAQGNWQANFDRGVFESDRDYNFNSYWQGKEFDTSNSRYDAETAKDEVWRLIQLGVSPNSDLIARAGMNETDVALAIEAVRAGTSGNTGNTGNNNNNGYVLDGNNDGKIDNTGNPTTAPTASGVTDEIKKKAASFTNNNALESYLVGLMNAGTITESEADSLYAQYVDDNEKYMPDSNAHSYSEMAKNTSGWTVVDDGGLNWFWGIDNNAILEAPNGEQIRLDVLLNKLQDEGMEKDAAKEAIKALQKNLGI